MAGEFVWIFFNAVYFHCKEWLLKHCCTASDAITRKLSAIIHVTNPGNWQEQLPTNADGDAAVEMIYSSQTLIQREAPKLWAKIADDAATFNYYEAATQQNNSVPPPETKKESKEEQDEEEEEEIVLPFRKRPCGSSSKHPIVLDEGDEEESVENKSVEPEHEELPDLPELNFISVDCSSDNEEEPGAPSVFVDSHEIVQIIGSGDLKEEKQEGKEEPAAPSTPINRGIKRTCPGAPIRPKVFIYKIILQRESEDKKKK